MLSPRHSAARMLVWLAIFAMPWQLMPLRTCGCTPGACGAAASDCCEDGVEAQSCETKRCPCTGASVCRCRHESVGSCCHSSTASDPHASGRSCCSKGSCCGEHSCCSGETFGSERSRCCGSAGCSCGDSCHCGESTSPPANPAAPPTDETPSERVVEAHAIASCVNVSCALVREAFPLAIDVFSLPQGAASTCVLLCRFTL